MSDPAWLPDPTGRHQYRWWDGDQWTHHVADDGVSKSDAAIGLDELSAPTSTRDTEIGHLELEGRTAYLGDGRTVTLASPGARLGAWLIDGLAIALFSLPFIVPLIYSVDFSEDSEDLVLSWGDFFSTFTGPLWPSSSGEWFIFFALLLVTSVYWVTFTATKGQTLGKMAAGIQVVRVEDCRIPGFKRAIRRWAIPGLLGLIPFIGLPLSYLCYLSLTWRRDRQGWHDSFASTVVVRVDRSAIKNARWTRTGRGQPVLLATPGARLGARLIDFEIIYTVWLIVLIWILSSSSEQGLEDMGASILLVLILPPLVGGILYEVVMTAIRGQTLGKMALGIKVIRSGTGANPGPAKSLGRWALPNLILFVPLIGWLISLLCYVSLTWGKDRQGWHDRAAGTVVVVKQSQ
ncbi:MAG: RDD family protein [bacterium]|nr:RDD family protein [bacterium]